MSRNFFKTVKNVKNRTKNFKKRFKTLNKNISPSLFNLLSNAKWCRCSIAETRDKKTLFNFTSSVSHKTNYS